MHPVSSELENSGIRVAVGDLQGKMNVGGGARLIKPAKLVTVKHGRMEGRTNGRKYENYIPLDILCMP